LPDFRGSSPCDGEPERTGVQTDEILKLTRLELQKTSSSLRDLKKEHLNLKEELHEKDEMIKVKQDELLEVHREVQRMKKLLGAQDADLTSLREQLHSKDVEIAKLDEEMAELRWNMPDENEQNEQTDVAKELKTLRTKFNKQQGELILSKEMDRKRADEITHLQRVVQDSGQQMKRLESAQEKELMDAELFIKSLAQTSAHPVLKGRFDLKNMSILGRGCYGHITLCKSTFSKSEEDVVMKWQSERWATVVMKEWAHGSEVGKHPHIVEYIDVFMHADHDDDVKDCLQAGFSSGALQGKQPKKFPGCYFCVAIEYMDRGTVQNLMDQDILTPESIGAITKQISSALAFMHSKQRTHNDIKPENILLKTSKDGKGLLAKLADFGMANHAVDRKRDCELFGYTIWCMGLQRKFAKVPAGDGQAEALQQFKDGVPNATKNQNLIVPSLPQSPSKTSANQSIEMLWSALYGVINGMWGMTLDMHEVGDIDTFEGLEVKVPECAKKDLEEAAKKDLHWRNVMRNTVFHKAVTRSCPTLPEIHNLLDGKRFDSNGADSESDWSGSGSEAYVDPSVPNQVDPNLDATNYGSNDGDWSSTSKNVATRSSTERRDKFASNVSTASSRGARFQRSKTVSHCMGEDPGLLSPEPPGSPKVVKRANLRRRRNSVAVGNASTSKIDKLERNEKPRAASLTINRPTWPAPQERRHSVERIRGVMLCKDVDDDPSSPINGAAIGLVGDDLGDLMAG
jgi:serine/threonine protein kinase